MLTLPLLLFASPFVFILASLFLAGCTKEDPTVAEEESESSAMAIGQVLCKEEDGTTDQKSSIELTSGSAIGIFLYEGTYYTQTAENVEYTYDGNNGWTSSDPIYLTKNEARLCAYYPYSNDTDYDDGTITLNSQLYTESADLCYETGVTASSEESVSFTLQHAYAELVFNFTKGEEYTGEGNITEISIANGNLATSGTLNLLTGTYSDEDTGTVSISTDISAGDSAKILMFPVTSMDRSFDLTFTVDGTEKTMLIACSDAGISSLEAGKSYTFNIEISTASEITEGTDTTANCYMIAPGTSLRIPVNVKGNGGDDADTDIGTSINPSSVGILWEDHQDLVKVSDFSSTDMTIKVTANVSFTGNAVIAAYSEADCEGDILWSWHIWVTDYDPDNSSDMNGNVYTYNDLTWMDRNLGATTTTAATLTTMGLLYQWGRKDPFPGAAAVSQSNSYNSIPIYDASGTQLTEGSQSGGTGITSVQVSASNNLSNSILNPMTFYYGVSNSNTGYDWYTSDDDHDSQNQAFWGSSDYTAATPGDKMIFDPCPAGWRVPAWSSSTSPWNGFTTSTFSWTATDYGRTYTSAGTFYPAAGCRSCGNGALYNVGAYGRYWSASVSATVRYSYNLNFYSSDVNPSYSSNRAYGFSVRCVQE